MDHSKKTISLLKNEIRNLGLNYPAKGSGTRGNLIKHDYINILKQYQLELEQKKEKLKQKKGNYSKYTVNELKMEIDELGLKYPVKRRLFKKDLIETIKNDEEKQKTELLHQSNPIGDQFLNKMPPEILRMTLLKLNVSDILNWCQINKEMTTKVCTIEFWQKVAKVKLQTEKLGTFKSWFELVKAMRWGRNDLVSISLSRLHQLETKNEAEIRIKKLIDNNKLTYKNKRAIAMIESTLEDYLEEKYQRLAYGEGEGEVNAVEVVVSERYSIYYNYKIDEFGVYEASTHIIYEGLFLASPGDRIVEKIKNYFEESKAGW